MPRKWSNSRGRKIARRDHKPWEPIKRTCVLCRVPKSWREFPAPQSPGYVTNTCFECFRGRKAVALDGPKVAPSLGGAGRQNVPRKPDLRWATWTYTRAD